MVSAEWKTIFSEENAADQAWNTVFSGENAADQAENAAFHGATSMFPAGDLADDAGEMVFHP